VRIKEIINIFENNVNNNYEFIIFSHDMNYCALGGSNTKIWNLNLKKKIFEFPGSLGAIFSKNNNILFTFLDSLNAFILEDQATKFNEISFQDKNKNFEEQIICCNENGPLFASHVYNRTLDSWWIKIYRLLKETVPFKLELISQSKKNLTPICFSSDGILLASYTDKKNIFLLNTFNGEIYREINFNSTNYKTGGYNNDNYNLTISRDNKFLITVRSENKFYIDFWNIKNGTLENQIESTFFDGDVSSATIGNVCTSIDDKFLFIGGNHAIYLIDLENNKTVDIIHFVPNGNFSFSMDGKYLGYIQTEPINDNKTNELSFNNFLKICEI
jgi:WD40 repeat protein